MSGISRLYHGENNYNFTRIWRIGLRVSIVLFLVSVGSLFFRGLNLGIEFKGGISWESKAFGTVEETRDVLRPLGLEEAKIQIIGTAGSEDKVRVEIASLSDEGQRQVRQTLADRAGISVQDVNVNNVGPTWGDEITQSALRALVVFLVCILGYVTATFRGEWKMAVGVVVAVVHDLVLSVGVYSIFYFDVTPATVVAFLTILGFSIYDTVVVYDKVLENSSRVGVTSRMTYTEMMNLSMNQVFLRSVNTSILAVLPVLSTLIVGSVILGATTLQEFAIALTVGLSIGAYSSIFVAAPVVALMKEREPRNRKLRERIEAVAVRETKGEGDLEPVPGGPSTRSASPTTRVVDPTQFSRNHPPRPRKQGKKR